MVNDPGVGSELITTSVGGISWKGTKAQESIFHAGSSLEIDFESAGLGHRRVVHLIVDDCSILEYTRDAGKSWEIVNLCLPANGAFEMDNDGTGWVIAESYEAAFDEAALFRTNNAGQTWSLISDQQIRYVTNAKNEKWHHRCGNQCCGAELGKRRSSLAKFR